MRLLAISASVRLLAISRASVRLLAISRASVRLAMGTACAWPSCRGSYMQG